VWTGYGNSRLPTAGATSMYYNFMADGLGIPILKGYNVKVYTVGAWGGNLGVWNQLAHLPQRSGVAASPVRKVPAQDAGEHQPRRCGRWPQRRDDGCRLGSCGCIPFMADSMQGFGGVSRWLMMSNRRLPFGEGGNGPTTYRFTVSNWAYGNGTTSPSLWRLSWKRLLRLLKRFVLCEP